VGTALAAGGVWAWGEADSIYTELNGAETCSVPDACGPSASERLDNLKALDVGANVAIASGAAILLYSTGIFDGLFRKKRVASGAGPVLTPFVSREGQTGLVLSGDL
jgi:hypothetical protein